jgi:hypothetical protein
MVGQGRPNSRRKSLAPWIVRLLAWLMVAPVSANLRALLAAEPTMTLRIAWGGGAERQWHGDISIDKGSLSLVRPLGIVADAPGSIWDDSNNRIEIRERSNRAYDGIDLDVVAPIDARIKVTLAADASAQGIAFSLPLSDLTDKTHRDPLDKQGNQLLIRRRPGDMLRIATNRDPLIFAPGETWVVDVNPRLLPSAAGTTVHLKSRLIPARGGAELWSQEQTAKWDPAAPPTVTLQIAMPRKEGVYDLVIEATERGGLPLRLQKVLSERRVQLVVLDSQPPADPAPVGWTQVMEIDPTSSHWYDLRRAIPKLPAFIPGASSIWQGPLVNGSMTTLQSSSGRAMQLAATAPGADPAWVAYPLSGAKPGLPHLLEIEYPSDVGQTLGISIVEPNASGTVAPYGLDSGVYTADEPLPGKPHWAKHRLLFWPRSSSPLVLLTNRRDGSRAQFGKIRLSAGPSRLPRAFPLAGPPPERLLAGYLNRPLFTANFSASESLDPLTGRSLTDWQTFYDGGTRLADYLNSVGYNGLMLNVFSEGSAIYPSKLLEPTPRFDTGAFFDQGQDPSRKDVLEMLLRMFDREHLKLIPTLQFSTPLPELEAILRAGGRDSDGIQLIGPDGLPWTDVKPAHHGLEPYYNPLDERVQRAILAVVHELVDRYGNHPSLAGLGLELSAHGYMQLPGEVWGLDDQTMQRFERDMRVIAGGDTGPGRFAVRAQFLSGPGRAQWRAWRCAVMADFHRRIAKELTSVRADARLYLAPTEMLDQPELERDLRPGLPSRGQVAEVMANVGISPQSYYNDPQIVLLRAQQIQPPGPPVAQGANIEMNRSAEWDRLISDGPSPGSLQYHAPQRLRLASFDAKSPLGKDKTYASLVSQFSPSQELNRQRFAHSLATLDSQAVFDGGWLLPLGQEDALRTLVAAYRRLPAGKFDPLPNCPQPLTIRTAQTADGTVAYLVNDSAWDIHVQLQTNAPAGVAPQELAGAHVSNVVGPNWSLDLGPYDLAVFQFAARNVRLIAPQVDMGAQARATLATAIADLKLRTKVLEAPPLWPRQPLVGLPNSGFEAPTNGGQIPGWTVTAGGQLTLDPNNPHGGNQSLRLSSAGGQVTLRSEPFPAPATGRIVVSVWLRVDDPSAQPQLRLALESLPQGQQFFRGGLLGAGTGTPIPNQWKQFIFPVDDLPSEGLQQLRFRVDLNGAGNLSIDDVQLFDLAFDKSEITQLSRIIALGDFQLNQNQLGDCQYELDGYWPRFLKANVPLPPPPIADVPPAAETPPPDKAAAKPGVVDRVKDLFRF